MSGKPFTVPPLFIPHPAMVRISRAELQVAASSPSYLPVAGPSVPHHLRKVRSSIRDRPDVYLANGRTLVQPRLPPLFGHVGLVERPVGRRDADVSERNTDAGYDDPFLLAPQRTPPPADRTLHRRKREAQWRRWQGEVLPNLLPHFVRVMHQTKSFRDYDDLEIPARSCACISKKCKVAVVRFTCKWSLFIWNTFVTDCPVLCAAVDDLELRVCACSPAAVQLMDAGAFPCAPLSPSLAVDLRVLEFAMNLFVQIAPNNTALTTTLERVLGSMGFQLEHQVRRVSVLGV